MDPKKRGALKFKIKTFLYYLIVEPWTEKVSLPNFRTIAWIFILVALFFRIRVLLLISILVGIISYMAQEFKSGKYIYWYRQRKFREQREALKKVRAEKKDKEKNNNCEGENYLQIENTNPES